MFAAAVAADRRIGALLVERKARLGSKVLMTANGRCNFTRDINADRFLDDLGFGQRAFLAQAVRECPPRQVIECLKSLGMSVRRMADGRMFPADGKAASVVHAFGDLLRDREVPVITNCAVRAIRRPDPAKPFVIETANFDLAAQNVLIATGGVSCPKTGSVGDGQRFAAEFGHRIVPYRPGLIGLETSDSRVTRFAGRRFEDDGRATIRNSKNQTLFDYKGEVDCEHFGLSGAAIYNAERFLEHFRRDGGSTHDLSLEVWFGHNRVTLQVDALKPRPLKESIVTIGGVATDEINPATMESRLAKGLYFAGEVMDIDGPTGGYNLTLAFATARKAVVSAMASRARR